MNNDKFVPYKHWCDERSNAHCMVCYKPLKGREYYSICIHNHSLPNDSNGHFIGYTLANILSRKSLTKLKGDKAIKNNILALIKNYNDALTNRYSSDNEYEQEPCCSEACLNMWILRN